MPPLVFKWRPNIRDVRLKTVLPIIIVVALVATLFSLSAPLSAPTIPPALVKPDEDLNAPIVDPSRAPLPNPPMSVNSATDAAMGKLSVELRGQLNLLDARLIPVVALTTTDTNWQPYVKDGLSRRPLGDVQWLSGEMTSVELLKLAGLPGVFAITTPQAFQPMPAPHLAELQDKTALPTSDLTATLHNGGKEALLRSLEQLKQAGRRDADAVSPPTVAGASIAEVNGASAAWTKGYTGTGVTVALIDTGVDFAHPDLYGTQARLSTGPYAGWPFAYDTLSGARYAADPGATVGPDSFWDTGAHTWYAHTLPVTVSEASGDGVTAELKLDYGSEVGWSWPAVTLPFTLPPTSKSGNYYYTVHPDLSLFAAAYTLDLGYAASDTTPPAVLLCDETTPGVYDTVYVDANFNRDFRDDKPMRQGSEAAGVDLNGDGTADLSAGMLTWIADGSNPPPGTAVLFDNVSTPEAGRLISFIGDMDAHGTSCASAISAQGMSDGDAQSARRGMAPGARIAAFQNGFQLPFDAWTLALLGFDGQPNSGDEAQIVSNSWGGKSALDAGWDPFSRFANWLNLKYAPEATFLAAAGNAGHGYGTAAAPSGGTIIEVGASTHYGSVAGFESVTPGQLTWGNVQPWSSRGPNALGEVTPDIVASGGYGTRARPLNAYFGNGEKAYDAFGGTSLASAVASGGAALIYQAFDAANGRWPTQDEVRGILLSSAHDLGYDVLTQGSGNLDADLATDVASRRGEGYWLEPTQWQPGNSQAQEYQAFPRHMRPGETVSASFTIENPSSSDLIVELADTTLSPVHEVTFAVPITSDTPASLTEPTWITDVSDLIEELSPDLVRAQLIFPSNAPSTDHEYRRDSRWSLLFYDWTDLNQNGRFWEDRNNNSIVDAGEMDTLPSTDGSGGVVHEYNRLSYNSSSDNYLEASVGLDSLSRRHDGVFLGLQRLSGSGPMQVQVRLVFYRQVDWDWLSTSSNSLSVPAGGAATFSASVQVPKGARAGLYEGAIVTNLDARRRLIPVIVNVVASSPSFHFGATSLNEPAGAHLYDNGYFSGAADHDGIETGDWRRFYFDIPANQADIGKKMIVETQWQDPATVTPETDVVFAEKFDDAFPPSGWKVVDNAGTGNVWQSNDAFAAPNQAGGSGNSAAADSGAVCNGEVWDAELWSPRISLIGSGPFYLGYQSHFREFSGAGDAWLDISTDDGANWQTLTHWTVERGPAYETVDLSAFAGQPVRLRWRYYDGSDGCAWHWHIDDVSIYHGQPDSPLPKLTDIDSFLFSAGSEAIPSFGQPLFGPQGVDLVAGSDSAMATVGGLRFDTASGGPHEVISGETNPGMGFISLHSTMLAGTQFAEPLFGRAYQVETSPYPVKVGASQVIATSPLTLAESWQQSFTTGITLAEGMTVTAYGLNQPTSFNGVELPADAMSLGDWVHTFSVSNGALIEIETSSRDIPDLDVYLYQGNQLLATSTTAGNEEWLRVKLPADGEYKICVENAAGQPGRFDLKLRTIQGKELTVSDVPSGQIDADTLVNFTVGFSKQLELGSVWEGILFVGPATAPTALEIPVTVRVAEELGLEVNNSATPAAVRQGDEFTYTVNVTNKGKSAYDVQMAGSLPTQVDYVPDSLIASKGAASWQPEPGGVVWNGSLQPGESAKVTFRALASGEPGQIENTVTVTGVTKDGVREVRTAKAEALIATTTVYLPLVGKNAE